MVESTFHVGCLFGSAAFAKVSLHSWEMLYSDISAEVALWKDSPHYNWDVGSVSLLLFHPSKYGASLPFQSCSTPSEAFFLLSLPASWLKQDNLKGGGGKAQLLCKPPFQQWHFNRSSVVINSATSAKALFHNLAIQSSWWPCFESLIIIGAR